MQNELNIKAKSLVTTLIMDSSREPYFTYIIPEGKIFKLKPFLEKKRAIIEKLNNININIIYNYKEQLTQQFLLQSLLNNPEVKALFKLYIKDITLNSSNLLKKLQDIQARDQAIDIIFSKVFAGFSEEDIRLKIEGEKGILVDNTKFIKKLDSFISGFSYNINEKILPYKVNISEKELITSLSKSKKVKIELIKIIFAIEDNKSISKLIDYKLSYLLNNIEQIKNNNYLLANNVTSFVSYQNAKKSKIISKRSMDEGGVKPVTISDRLLTENLHDLKTIKTLLQDKTIRFEPNSKAVRQLLLYAMYRDKELLDLLALRIATFDDPDYLYRMALHDFARLNDLISLQKLLSFRDDFIELTNEYGHTLLHYAVMEEKEELIIDLLTGGANINSLGNCGKTPLHIAVYSLHKDQIKRLLDYGADINAIDKYGKTVIEYANIDNMVLLCKEGAEFDPQSKVAYMLFDKAKQDKDDELLKILQDQGIKFDAKGEYEQVLLKECIRNNDHELLKVLLSQAIQIPAKDKSIEPMLRKFLYSGNLALIKELLKNIKISLKGELAQDILRQSLDRVDEELFKMLINRGINIKGRDKEGKTPLHLVVSTGNLEAAKLLLDNGANFDDKDSQGYPVWHYIVRNENNDVQIELIKGLLKSETKFSLNNDFAQHLLQQSLDKVDKKLFKMLIDKGVNIRSRDKEGKTHLHLAVLKGNLDAVELLLHNDANLYDEDRHGYSVLHYIARIRDNDLQTSMSKLASEYFPIEESESLEYIRNSAKKDNKMTYVSRLMQERMRNVYAAIIRS